MYVLARHEGESIVLAGGQIEIKVLNITGKIARIGIEAPKEISVDRKEIHVQRQKDLRNGD